MITETHHVKPVIKEAVGLARAPGSNNFRKDVQRFIRRQFVWLIFKSRMPYAWRERALGIVLRYRIPLFSGATIGNNTENNILKLIFTAVAWANMADNAASSPRTNIVVCLHTADPGEAGTGATSECAYTGYLRVLVARTTGGWTVTTNSVSPVANIDFPACTAGSETATFFSVVSATATTAGVASDILFSGAISPTIPISNGTTPRLTTASACTLD